LNIELLTSTEVIDLKGTQGCFTASVQTNPRYVDLLDCTSCGECEKVCPVELANEYDAGMSVKKAVYKRYPQAIPGAFAIEKQDKAPCTKACPAGINVQGYVQMVKQGKYSKALEIIMEDLPLPGVLGRICPHECEDKCRRREVDQPVAIRNLKRLAADQFDPRQVKIKCHALRKEKVAIIGSGPSGLSAAYHLSKKGICSTVFEALAKPGGMLRTGIPEYRLPRKILDEEIEVITNLGVKIRTNSPLGDQMTLEDLFSDGYSAVYLAMGAHKGIKLGINGEKADGVCQGIDFLREVNLTGKAKIGRKVVIIGGGNVAIDVSRLALRLGADEVLIVYRRTREQMPAWEEEIQAAEHEGVRIKYLSSPVEILTVNGKAEGLRCIRMELGEPDLSGRRRPVPIHGSEYEIKADHILPAIGQMPDISAISKISGITFSKWGTIEVDPITYSAGREGVFAGGDLRTGPGIAIEAVAQGSNAAESIVRYLDGKDMSKMREPVVTADNNLRPIPDDEMVRKRAEMAELASDNRKNSFDEVELGFDEKSGQYEADRCLNCGFCCECHQCVDVCLAKAINHDQKTVKREIEVGAVILSSGVMPFDPGSLEEFYHYKSSPNVLTSLEFERILSASGPTLGHLIRPSDKKEPKKIAWIQCVGSRDTNRSKNGYCSFVCCMSAVKDAMIAREHAGYDLDCVIFNMDMRTFGKNYERYYNRAKESGVGFVKSRIHTIDMIKETDDLRLRYVDESGNIKVEDFDMVVLSVGLIISESSADMAKRLGVSLDEHNFVKNDPFMPLETSRKGVYACGGFQGPNDIPGSVTQASAAACAAGTDLSMVRGSCAKKIKVPDEIDITGQSPRVGVFVCRCGINIAGVVNVPEVVEYAKSLDNVMYAEENLFTCSQDSQDQIKKVIKDKKLNRIVVASCTPKTHETIFMDTLEACGLNKYLFEMANIRNQNSWIHSDCSDEATEKAKELTRMAVARAVTLYPLFDKKIPVTKRALVIGGGISGLTAALGLADSDIEVLLIEKENRLGGMSLQLTETIEGKDIGTYVNSIIQKVQSHGNIQVLTNSIIVGFSGFKGNFTTEVLVGPGMYERKIEHGAVILATGANEYKPDEYLYGQNPSVVTQIELSKKLKENNADGLDNVVMIQCVGSRNKDYPNCSRICCQAAIKNALHIKQINQDANVYILYRDIRMYGLLEQYYTKARQMGIVFFRYDVKNPPDVKAAKQGVMVTFKDHVLDRDLCVEADLLALSAGVRPEDTEELTSILKLARDEDGYFMEAHVKLRPVDMVLEGIYICGSSHGPKLISESISQAMAAAGRATTLLSQTQLSLSAVKAVVEKEKCASCLICVRSCPYEVPKINKDGVSEIDAALCQGCGVCASECPAKAIALSWYEDNQILSKVESLLVDVI